jgi:hypothetical protein
MGHVAGTTFGIGTPTAFPVPAISGGVFPYAGQAPGVQPFPQQSFSNQSIAGYGIGTAQPLQQILQFLQPETKLNAVGRAVIPIRRWDQAPCGSTQASRGSTAYQPCSSS